MTPSSSKWSCSSCCSRRLRWQARYRPQRRARPLCSSGVFASLFPFCLCVNLRVAREPAVEPDSTSSLVGLSESGWLTESAGNEQQRQDRDHGRGRGGEV